MNIHTGNGSVHQIPVLSIDTITYTVLDPGLPATLTTSPGTNVTANSASSGGTVDSDGGSTVTHRGVCWDTSPLPTTANSTTLDGSGLGVFSSSISGLSGSTTYYVRSYAINSAGTSYGDEVQFNTPPAGGYFVQGDGVDDIEGHTYPTVVLVNGQEWMAEDLRTASYANGEAIPNVLVDAEWQGQTAGGWCHFNNDAQYEVPFGKLYNFFAVVDPRGLCPSGWHVPTDAEWNELVLLLDPDADPEAVGEQSGTAGGLMKATGNLTIGDGVWYAPNQGATNESGFEGLPGSKRFFDGQFFNVPGADGHWWSSSLSTPFAPWLRSLNYYVTQVYRFNDDRNSGYSVRCLRD